MGGDRQVDRWRQVHGLRQFDIVGWRQVEIGGDKSRLTGGVDTCPLSSTGGCF